MRNAFIFFFCVLALAFVSSQHYPSFYPTHFPTATYNFDKNPLDSMQITLGRALFYDPILSKDSTISCASCHSPYNSFAHSDHDLSHGINNQIGKRNAPALFNLAWHKNFMWDGAVNHLEVQALSPISNPIEMDENIAHLVEKLSHSALYKTLAWQAYGDSLLTGEYILKSLAQFQLTLVSANALYDKVKQGKASYNLQQEKGYRLFLQYCNACHTEPLFSNFSFANNGLAPDSTLNDAGRWEISKFASDSLLFKVPSLRNLSYTYPYMHDGRFKKLYQVLNHYSSGITQSATLSPLLQGNLPLSAENKVDIIAFLLTLNDSSFVFTSAHQFPQKIFFPAKE
ncbi:MAG: cytochrome-c peroxidase [Chitinophagales bacterium]